MLRLEDDGTLHVIGDLHIGGRLFVDGREVRFVRAPIRGNSISGWGPWE